MDPMKVTLTGLTKGRETDEMTACPRDSLKVTQRLY